MKKLIVLLLVAFSVSVQAQTVFKPEGFQTVTTTGTVNVTAGVGIVNVNPASVLATATINFPATPADRDIFLMTFGGTVTGNAAVVTLLTLTAGSGILGAGVTTGLAGTSVEYIYLAKTDKWYRLF